MGLDIRACVFWWDNLFTCALNDTIHMPNGELPPNLWSENRQEVTRHDVTSLEHQTRNMSQAIFSSLGLYLFLMHQHTQEETSSQAGLGQQLVTEATVHCGSLLPLGDLPSELPEMSISSGRWWKQWPRQLQEERMRQPVQSCCSIMWKDAAELVGVGPKKDSSRSSY